MKIREELDDELLRRETSPLRTDKDRRKAGALLPCKGDPSRRFGYARVKRREINPLRT